MKVTLAQMPVTSNIESNLDNIKSCVNQAEGDVVIFPEGALSGYEAESDDYINNINFTKLEEAHNSCKELAKQSNKTLLIGSIKKEDVCYNTTYIFHSDGRVETYNKANLAFHDKKHFKPGNELPLFEINNEKIAILMCREIMYPEQWRILSMKGAKVLFHLDNCLGGEKYNLWKSYLVARAGENQRFVISVNNANVDQGCPTLAVDPKGKIIEEIKSPDMIFKTISLNLEEVQDYYLGQQRKDLVEIVPK